MDEYFKRLKKRGQMKKEKENNHEFFHMVTVGQIVKRRWLIGKI